MTKHLVLRLQAPLMSFGGVAVDNRRISSAWPSASLLAGLFGNALGYRRVDAEKLQHLQERLVYACRVDFAGDAIQDFQTAQLAANDHGWTTHHAVEGRKGASYHGPNLLYKDYWADRIMTICCRLDPPSACPSIDDIANAVREPARPLFIGRKTCLPASPLYYDVVEGDDALSVLTSIPRVSVSNPGKMQAWSSEGINSFVDSEYRMITTSGKRIWANSVHGGQQTWYEGKIEVQA